SACLDLRASVSGIISAETPQLALEVPRGILARPIGRVVQLADNLRARFPGARVMGINIPHVDIQTVGGGGPGVGGVGCRDGSEHDGTGSEPELGMSDRAVRA